MLEQIRPGLIIVAQKKGWPETIKTFIFALKMVAVAGLSAWAWRWFSFKINGPFLSPACKTL